MPDQRGLELRGTDVQLAAIALPQRLRGDIENATDFTLRHAFAGKHLDKTAVG
ncbi:hypothetical protein K6M90_11380 [Rhizobium sp. 9T]|uniref:hypothetical protein n=1 Tax=Rhizobium croatiense TaxID=2867516 RepID=UPI001C931F6D|nr:hypothetical protein [Rhizobium croatiense]MBY4608247.1 hypothetical protein [Rhizobium croatiense]